MHLKCLIFFPRYKDLFFDVITGPAPSFTFTLSLTFDYKDRVYLPVPCVPRWQMTAMEYAVSRNYSRGDVDTGRSYSQFVFFSPLTRD